MSGVERDIVFELQAASRYAANDPQGALAKLRIILERTVRLAFVRLANCELPAAASLNDMLEDVRFASVVPTQVLQRMHDVRLRGNRAMHGERVSHYDVQVALDNIHAILEWATRCGLVHALPPKAIRVVPPPLSEDVTPPPLDDHEMDIGTIILLVLGYAIFVMPPVAMLAASILRLVLSPLLGEHAAQTSCVGGLVAALLLPLVIWRKLRRRT